MSLANPVDIHNNHESGRQFSSSNLGGYASSFYHSVLGKFLTANFVGDLMRYADLEIMAIKESVNSSENPKYKSNMIESTKITSLLTSTKEVQIVIHYSQIHQITIHQFSYTQGSFSAGKRVL